MSESTSALFFAIFPLIMAFSSFLLSISSLIPSMSFPVYFIAAPISFSSSIFLYLNNLLYSGRFESDFGFSSSITSANLCLMKSKVILPSGASVPQNVHLCVWSIYFILLISCLFQAIFSISFLAFSVISLLYSSSCFLLYSSSRLYLLVAKESSFLLNNFIIGANPKRIHCLSSSLKLYSSSIWSDSLSISLLICLTSFSFSETFFIIS